jgi:DNA-binding response OmpR family regulator
MESPSLTLKEHALACGADDFVTEPFEIKCLIDKIQKWTQSK